MTAPRAREQSDPPSPPDRRPPRRGGGSSPRTYAASAASRRVAPVARRGLVRSARALTAAALLALTGALFLPASAEAQAVTTLVSNTGQGTYSENFRRAMSQRFTTGSNEDGYTLTGVDVASASSTGFTAKVCGVDSSDDNRPTSTCTNLTAPGTFAVGTMSFTAPADTLLMKETTYAVVVTALATNTPGSADMWTGVAQGWGLANNNDEDADPAVGWSLSDDGHEVRRNGTLGSWAVTNLELRIAIKGAAGVLGLAQPTNFTAAVGNAQVVLSWDPPASDSGVTRHEYQFKTGTGAYGDWVQIANSGVGGTNEDGFTVTGLTNEVLHTFQLRAVNSEGDESAASESDPVTPTPGICGRTQIVYEIIVDYLSDRDNCAEVNVADLESFTLSLEMAGENIASLKSGDFAGLSNLQTLELSRNTFTTLPANVFSDLSNLQTLGLRNNKLTSLPAGLFSGLTGLTTLILGANPDAGDKLPLTVTVEKVGTDRVRAKVLAGAPFAVAISVTPANGTLAGDVTVLTVAAGSVESAAVTVTRTEGTTAAVTVDVDLTTQPSLPSLPAFHQGYEFARAASGLPAEILPEAASLEPPTGLTATPGDREAVLRWTPPAADSGFTRHQYRYRTDGDFGGWTDISDSGPGGANASRYTVTDLANAVEHTFELRARDAGAGKSDPATVKVTPAGPPRIVSVEVTSGPALDNETTYGAGEEIRIEVTFDQPVEVSGDPELALDVGGERLAEYDSGEGTETLVFVYVVRASDDDDDGVSVGDDALRLDGNDGIDNGAGDEAELAHGGLGLHARKRQAPLRAGRDREDGRGAGARRRGGRGRGDLHAAAPERLGGGGRRRRGDGHDRQLRPVAEDVAVALRAHGGGPGGGRGDGPPVGADRGLAGDAGRAEHRPLGAVGRDRRRPAHARRGAPTFAPHRVRAESPDITSEVLRALTGRGTRGERR